MEHTHMQQVYDSGELKWHSRYRTGSMLPSPPLYKVGAPEG